MYYRSASYFVSILFVRILYGLIHLFIGRKRRLPLKDFEENPKTMGWRGALYLGYKYLYRPHTESADRLYGRKYFRTQKLPLVYEKPKKNELVINLAGDMKQHDLFVTKTTSHLRDDIGQEYFDADTVIANLETPIDVRKKTHKDPLVMLHDIYFNAHKNFYNIFSDHGKRKYSLLRTANNHCLDQGKEGNVMTCRFLDEQGIPYTGSRLTKKYPRYHLITKKGITVAYINYTFSCNQNIPSEEHAFAINYLRLNNLDTDISQITNDVLSAKKAGAEFVILCPHMGNAYQLYPSGHIVRMVHRFFDECGVDAVVCTHPHNLQPMEMYTFTDPHSGTKKQGFVIYSLGDFVSYDVFARSHLSAILQLRLKKTKSTTKISGIHLLPLYMHRHRRTSEFRLLDLEKLVSNIRKNQAPEFLDAAGKKEALALHDLLHTSLLPAGI